MKVGHIIALLNCSCITASTKLQFSKVVYIFRRQHYLFYLFTYYATCPDKLNATLKRETWWEQTFSEVLENFIFLISYLQVRTGHQQYKVRLGLGDWSSSNDTSEPQLQEGISTKPVLNLQEPRHFSLPESFTYSPPCSSRLLRIVNSPLRSIYCNLARIFDAMKSPFCNNPWSNPFRKNKIKQTIAMTHLPNLDNACINLSALRCSLKFNSHLDHSYNQSLFGIFIPHWWCLASFLITGTKLKRSWQMFSIL